jgi:hypothetical protein
MTVAFMSPTVHEVAGVQACVEVRCDLSRDTSTPPWRDLQDPIELTVEALRALADGSIKVRIGSVLALEDVNEAFHRLSSRAVQVKLVLDLAR